MFLCNQLWLLKKYAKKAQLFALKLYTAQTPVLRSKIYLCFLVPPPVVRNPSGCLSSATTTTQVLVRLPLLLHTHKTMFLLHSQK